MTTDLRKQAIDAALSQDWTQAVELNRLHLDENPKDFDSYNRLGFAFMQLNKFDKASKAYKKTLELDPYNSIAKKSLEKILLLKSGKTTPQRGNSPVKTSFLEEPGKTKSVTLTRSADPKILASLNVGIPLQLSPKKYRINVDTLSSTYIGALPDDVSHKLFKLLKQGYKYECWIKSINSKSVCIFLKEQFRPKKFSQIPSFPAAGTSKTPFTLISGQSLIEEPLDVTSTGEEE
jgi:tetratricopeptide (TPR) repeat protein